MRKIERFKQWSQSAPAGDVFVYHRGTRDAIEKRDEQAFAYARKLSDGGLALLFQRRIGPPRLDGGSEFEYCAKRTRAKKLHILERIASVSVFRNRPQSA